MGNEMHWLAEGFLLLWFGLYFGGIAFAILLNLFMAIVPFETQAQKYARLEANRATHVARRETSAVNEAVVQPPPRVAKIVKAVSTSVRRRLILD